MNCPGYGCRNHKRNPPSVLEKVGCTTLQQVYLSSKLYKEFTEKRHDKLVEKAHWRQAFQVLEIRITENAAAKYASIDTAPLIKELNRKTAPERYPIPKSAYIASLIFRQVQKTIICQLYGRQNLPLQFLLPPAKHKHIMP